MEVSVVLKNVSDDERWFWAYAGQFAYLGYFQDGQEKTGGIDAAAQVLHLEPGAVLVETHRVPDLSAFAIDWQRFHTGDVTLLAYVKLYETSAYGYDDNIRRNVCLSLMQTAELAYTAPEEAEAPWDDNQDAAREARRHMQSYFDARAGEAAGWPDCYGGCYIAARSSILTVCLTDLTPENIALFEEACQTTDLTFEAVRWSYAELLEAYELAVQLFVTAVPDSANICCRVSASDNCVHAAVAREMAQQADAFAREHPCFIYTLADAGEVETD